LKNKAYLTLSAVLLSFILLLGAIPTEDVFADDDCDDLKGKEKRDCKKQEKEDDDDDDNGDDDGNDDDDKPKDSKCSRDLKNPWKIKPLCELFLLLLDLRDALVNNDDTLPSAGTDRFPVIGEMEFGNPDFIIELGLTGTLTMDRSEPFEDGSTGKWTIDTEIVSMELVGEDPELATIVLRQSSTQSSLGNIAQQTPGGEDFPADSFFDIFIELDIEGIEPDSGIVLPLFNMDPLRVQTLPVLPVSDIPPIGTRYFQEECVDLFASNDPPLGFAVVEICNLQLIPTSPAEEAIKKEILQLEMQELAAASGEMVSCEDGNACTINDSFQDGFCQGGPQLSCNDNNVCTFGSCDMNSGCIFFQRTDCDDFNPCTFDGCDSSSGCFNKPIPNCDNSNFCSMNSDCDDGLACTVEGCENLRCEGGILKNNCVIDNACYANDDVNPANECEFCRADLTPDENILNWSNVADGTSCGAPGQTCQAGICI